MIHVLLQAEEDPREEEAAQREDRTWDRGPPGQAGSHRGACEHADGGKWRRPAVWVKSVDRRFQPSTIFILCLSGQTSPSPAIDECVFVNVSSSMILFFSAGATVCSHVCHCTDIVWWSIDIMCVVETHSVWWITCRYLCLIWVFKAAACCKTQSDSVSPCCGRLYHCWPHITGVALVSTVKNVSPRPETTHPNKDVLSITPVSWTSSIPTGGITCRLHTVMTVIQIRPTNHTFYLHIEVSVQHFFGSICW